MVNFEFPYGGILWSGAGLVLRVYMINAYRGPERCRYCVVGFAICFGGLVSFGFFVLFASA